MKEVLLIYKRGQWGTGRLSYLLEVTELMTGRTKTQTQIVLVQSPRSDYELHFIFAACWITPWSALSAAAPCRQGWRESRPIRARLPCSPSSVGWTLPGLPLCHTSEMKREEASERKHGLTKKQGLSQDSWVLVFGAVKHPGTSTNTWWVYFL